MQHYVSKLFTWKPLMLPISSRNTTETTYTDLYFNYQMNKWVQKEVVTNGKVQAQPYNLDLPYSKEIFVRLAGVISPHAWNFGGAADLSVYASVANRARAKFVSKLGDTSSFGATLTAEARQTWSMLTSTTTKLLLAARAAVRGDLVKVARILEFNPPTMHKTIVVKRRKRSGRYYKKTRRREYWVMPDGRHVAKGLANRWLFYSYGVKPLVQDLYNGLDVLQRPLPYSRIAASASGEIRRVTPYESYVFKEACLVTAEVRVKNPNLYLANQMGLTNPLQWINEGIPFSFVLDWFSNWSQVISQFTDFVGLEIAKPRTTRKQHIVYSVPNDGFGSIGSKERKLFVRELAIPTPKLKFAYERFQWQRGANAISLLVGLIKRHN